MVFKTYARYYDAFYQTKDYKEECLFLEALARRHNINSFKTILDLGCGTANHLIPLAERGYVVTGMDASKDMLSVAKMKLKQKMLQAKLSCQPLQRFQFSQKFDLIICMFSVFDYLIKDHDIKQTLMNISNHMGQRSLFILDFWNAPAVVKHYTAKKRKVFEWNNKKVERRSETRLLTKRNLCEVKYTCRLLDSKNTKNLLREKHILRYFSPEEIKTTFKQCGLEVLDFYPFLNIDGKISSNTWDVTAVACKL